MFDKIISAIKPLDDNAMERCQTRIDNLSKPLGSLHSFEHLALKMAGITGNPRPRTLSKSIIIMTGGYTTAGAGYCQKSCAVDVFAKHVSANISVVDISAEVDRLTVPAMRFARAIELGIKAVNQEIHMGAQVIGLGAMGPGSSNAGITIVDCCSVSTEEALTTAVPDAGYYFEILCKAGSLEIAGLVGVILGAAAGRAAVVLDGLATSAAALLAVKIAPIVKDYLIGSHFSVDQAHKTALNLIGVPAYLHLDMPGGDGSGAALGMSLINASLHVINDMKTFGDAEVAVAQDGPGALRQSKDIKD